ncbi:MAG TPA: DUF1223 domain-containing protein [Beijerinckiaceae bacterium]|nr:DUF1223 domain-containing protein [Beijerinckiaceae bacterium]
MRFLVQLRSLSLASAAALILAVGADGQTRPEGVSGVLELFTSQGCSSCPPADALLTQLADKPDLITLSLPVDYWDYIGWKDTLALPAFTERQKNYAAARGDGQVYTPQVVIDGVAHVVGSNAPKIEQAIKDAAAQPNVFSVSMHVAKVDGDLVGDVGAAGDGVPRWGSILLLQVAKKRIVSIARGENAGRTVTYTNVVRSLDRIGMWNGAAMHFDVPAGEIMPRGDGYVVLLQSGRSDRPGAILAAVKSDGL